MTEYWTPCAQSAKGWQDATVPDDACSQYLRSVGFEPLPKQYDFITCPASDVGFGGARGGAKLQPLDAKVLTPFGWKLMGDLKLGDVVTDPTTGGHSTVIKVHEHGPMQIYRVVCDDGATTEVGAEHLWAFKRPNHIRPRTKFSSQRQYAIETLGSSMPSERWNNYVVGDTMKLIEVLKGGERPRIPLTEPILFTVNGRTGTGILPPYLLGLMLGDGTLGAICMTACEDHIREYLLSVGFVARQTDLHTDGKSRTYGAKGAIRKALVYWLSEHKLRQCRSWEKYIPDYVLTAPIEYRTEFLRGLMDTDGTVDDRGHLSFTSTSHALATGVSNLVRSLGGKATVSAPRRNGYTHNGEKLIGRDAYTVYIWHGAAKSLFGIPRKRARCVNKWNGGHENMRAIVSITPTRVIEARCITVSSPYGLYVTDDYIVTHNSAAIVGDWLWHDKQYGANAIGIVFRRERTQLVEFIEYAKRFFEPRDFKWKALDKTFVGPTGSRLRFEYLDKDHDADNYQGSSFTRVYVEERGTFPREATLNKLQATLRSGVGVPCQMKSTFNPGGVGHQHCRERYRLFDKIPKGYEIFRSANGGTRVFIPSRLRDNKYLGEDYIRNLREACAGNDALLNAWLDGDWSIVEGAFFENWRSDHVIEPFDIPQDWLRFRSFRWGSARPFSVGWWTLAGHDVAGGDTPGGRNGPAIPKGSLIRYREWYGAKGGQPDTGLKLQAELIAAGIAERTGPLERIAYTMASPQIFNSKGGPSIAERMGLAGVPLLPAVDNYAKNVGNSGAWDQLRARLVGTEGIPAIFCFNTCADSVRTIPALQHDRDHPEDVDDESEDHAAIDWRFAVMSRPWFPQKREIEQPRQIVIGGLTTVTMDDLWKNHASRQPTRF